MVAAVTACTARSMAASVRAEGAWIPPTFLTYWRAAASISSGVASGSRPLRVVMLRHMAATVSPPTARCSEGSSEVAARDPSRERQTRGMATTRTARTRWNGSLMEGSGQVTLESSGLGTYDVTWASRAEDPNGRTSPEELIAAAHSSCFSMALSNGLAKDGNPPESLETSADVTFQPGEGITGIHITVRGTVPGLSAEQFQQAAETAKENCPVSKALGGTSITLDASLA